MKVQFFALTVFLGVILAVHLAMNGKVGEAINNTPVANAVFWCIGALTAIAIGLTGWQAGALAPLKDVNPWLLCAGVMGALLVFAIAWLNPKMGSASLFITLLAGQVIAGVVMSHYGWLGSPVEPVTLMKVVGVTLMIGGAAIVTFVK